MADDALAERDVGVPVVSRSHPTYDSQAERPPYSYRGACGAGTVSRSCGLSRGEGGARLVDTSLGARVGRGRGHGEWHSPWNDRHAGKPGEYAASRPIHLGKHVEHGGQRIEKVATSQIYWGAMPFIVIQLIMVAIIIVFPGVVSVEKHKQFEDAPLQIEMPAPEEESSLAPHFNLEREGKPPDSPVAK